MRPASPPAASPRGPGPTCIPEPAHSRPRYPRPVADRSAAEVPEAGLRRTTDGIEVAGAGWFVLNLTECVWKGAPGRGRYGVLESSEAPFEQFGIGVHVLEPGERNGMYHGEDAQEGFLVLSGECLLLIEGRERRLGPWDFVHVPPWTRHIFVGAGDGPCAILMVGARVPGRGIEYPVEPLALRHRAGVERATTSPKEAYADAPALTTRPFQQGDLPCAAAPEPRSHASQ